MEETQDFFNHYRPLLLAWLDADNRLNEARSGPLDFVDEVLDGWSKFAQGRVLEAPSPRERAFWFALYQFEELVENPVTARLDPYEAILMQNLAEAREALRAGRGLPDGLFATRPGELPEGFDDEELL